MERGNIKKKGSQTEDIKRRNLGISQKWDTEADVIILGFGGAGACAAIEAADAGAKVLILEKQSEETHYSNTRMSGGCFHSPDPSGNKSALKEYVKAMFSAENLPWVLEGEQPEYSDALAEAFAEYAPLNTEFLKKADPDFQPYWDPSKGAAFSLFPGAVESKYRMYQSSYGNPGRVDIPTKNLPKSEKLNGEAFFTALKVGVEKRGVKVLYNTPARRLITNEKGEVIGVVALKESREITCKAKRAVILTTGGFEFNKEMRRAFLEGPGVEGWAFYGSPANTGDGIEMAMKVGAALMKVGNAACRLVFAPPSLFHGLKIGVMTESIGGTNTLIVDNYGKRYADETLVVTDPSRYFFYKEVLRFDIQKLLYPRVPSWMVIDETLRSNVSVATLGMASVGYDFVPWKKDNLDAIKRGWIMQADTIEALAKKIRVHPENRNLMVPTDLLQTIARFNEFCKKGKDEDFGRNPDTLGPIQKPPFYALPLYVGGPNTTGGIAANARREVVDWKGVPIPRLYSAGEICSAFLFTYQGGGNLAECIVFGRIAGKNAAFLEPWTD